MIAGSAKPVISLRASCMPMPKPSAKPSPLSPTLCSLRPLRFLSRPLRPFFIRLSVQRTSLLGHPGRSSFVPRDFSLALWILFSSEIFARTEKENFHLPHFSYRFKALSIVIRFSCSLYCFFICRTLRHGSNCVSLWATSSCDTTIAWHR